MNRLHELAVLHETDKAEHGYCEVYDKKLSGRALEPLNVLEVGVYMGGSLRMWRDYLPNATIQGVDLNVTRCGEVEGATLAKLDVADRKALEGFAARHGPWDLILDDASHTMKHQQRTLDLLWPHLKPGGYYVIEDLHTSFMPKLEHHCADLEGEKNATTFALVEALKHERPFSSRHLTKERFEQIRASVEHVTIWVREPKEHSHQLTSDNSVTSMLLKRSI